MIGETIGNVLNVDVDTNDTGWGKHLRAGIELPLSKPLARGIHILVKGEKC